jgi:hypothetical protein
MQYWSKHKKKLLTGSLFALAFLAILVTGIYLATNNKLTFITSAFEKKDQTPKKTEIDCKNFQEDASSIIDKLSLNKKWALLGKEFPESDQYIRVNGTLKTIADKYTNQDNPIKITYSLKDSQEVTTGEYNTETHEYKSEMKFSELKPAKYNSTISFEFKCGKIEKDLPEITVTYPAYVAWSLDYEGFDIPDSHLNDITTIASKYNIRLTHFYNPRIYTNPEITTARQEALTNFVKNRKAQYNETIGLHLHMFPEMVKAAGVDAHSNPQTWGGYRTDGYNILVLSYNYDEISRIMKWSKEVFADKGIATPTIFRAGGWFADLSTLRAAQDQGFVADSSGRTKYILDVGGPYGPWDLQSTTQPYQPSASNQNVASAPQMSIWEFPNNGADSWAYSADQMIEKFKDNYNGTPLNNKVLVTYISHPEWFYVDKPKMESVFDFIHNSMYETDSGPVIFIDLDQAYNIWTAK